jgi:hypothetical protein
LTTGQPPGSLLGRLGSGYLAVAQSHLIRWLGGRASVFGPPFPPASARCLLRDPRDGGTAYVADPLHNLRHRATDGPTIRRPGTVHGPTLLPLSFLALAVPPQIGAFRGRFLDHPGIRPWPRAAARPVLLIGRADSKIRPIANSNPLALLRREAARLAVGL